MIESTNSKKLMLFSGRGHPELADDVASELDTELTPTSLFDFANGEIFVRYEQSVRGSDAFVIQSHTTPVNTWIMEQLIMVDALRRPSASQLSPRSTATPARTRSTADVSQSQPG
jgi:ribose-phosphate pyrophosphokinase